MNNILLISFLVGFFGDLLLQLGVKFGFGGETGWGLKGYFKQHGCIESLFIAGGMMTLFHILVLNLNWNEMGLLKGLIYLSIYGIILDLLFRKFMIFPSLEGYYNYFNYFWSGFWEVFSMCLPFVIMKLL